ncbi:MAG: hypothetical protein JSS21_11820 [Proteobacteria bacterium]|nr:hypothetical protein [Pseudomonadota bacterium]
MHALTAATAALLLCAGSLAFSPRASAAADLECKMKFAMKGWSVIIKKAEGRGVVTCANGESMPVHLEVIGGGLTAGKWQIDDGTGSFTDVHHIREVLGSYAQGEASAAAIKAGTAQVLTKGTVSLALAGVGQGIDLGLSGAKFTITRAEPMKHQQ